MVPDAVLDQYVDNPDPQTDQQEPWLWWRHGTLFRDTTIGKWEILHEALDVQVQRKFRSDTDHLLFIVTILGTAVTCVVDLHGRLLLKLP